VSSSFTVRSSLVVADGDYVVLGVNDNSSTNGGVTVDYDWGTTTTFVLGNSGDEIYLAESSARAVIFDSVEYDGGDVWPDSAGYSMNLSPDHLDADFNDWGGNWCFPSSMYHSSNYGTPGAANDSCGFSVTFSANIEPLLNTYCASCHGSAGSGGFSNVTDHATLVTDTASTGAPMIDPGNPLGSYLYAKVDPTTSGLTVSVSGAQMPYGSSISTIQRQLIRQWIQDGAPQ
jgi:hypothetical protein